MTSCNTVEMNKFVSRSTGWEVWPPLNLPSLLFCLFSLSLLPPPTPLFWVCCYQCASLLHVAMTIFRAWCTVIFLWDRLTKGCCVFFSSVCMCGKTFCLIFTRNKVESKSSSTFPSPLYPFLHFLSFVRPLAASWRLWSSTWPPWRARKPRSSAQIPGRHIDIWLNPICMYVFMYVLEKESNSWTSVLRSMYVDQVTLAMTFLHLQNLLPE